MENFKLFDHYLYITLGVILDFKLRVSLFCSKKYMKMYKKMFGFNDDPQSNTFQ